MDRIDDRVKLEAAEREVKQRKRVYPRLIEAGKMTQEFADRQTAIMEAIAQDYRDRVGPPAQGGLL